MARRKAYFFSGNIQFRGEHVGIERAAGKKAVAHLDRGHLFLWPSRLDLKHQILGVDVFVDIHFDEVHAAILQELFGAAAIDAPSLVQAHM